LKPVLISAKILPNSVIYLNNWKKIPKWFSGKESTTNKKTAPTSREVKAVFNKKQFCSPFEA
jgi:hypothetical protein